MLVSCLIRVNEFVTEANRAYASGTEEQQAAAARRTTDQSCFYHTFSRQDPNPPIQSPGSERDNRHRRGRLSKNDIVSVPNFAIRGPHAAYF